VLIIAKGLLLGLVAGCLTTIGDALVSLNPFYPFAIPRSYPFVLITVNAVVWGLLGCISGMLVLYLTKKASRSSFDRYEDLRWVICFVVPFFPLYVALGSLLYDKGFFYGTFESSYLSIAGIGLALGCLGILTFTRARKGKSSPFLFLPELLLIIVVPNYRFWAKLFQFTGLPQSVPGGSLYVAFFFVAVYLLTLFACTRLKQSPVLPTRALGGLFCLLFPLTLVSTFQLSRQTTPVFSISRNILQEARAKTPSPILLVVLDCARADRLSTYGYPKPTSPNLDTFAREALVFKNCYAASSWTLPSHASLFTGLYPSEHGAHFGPPETDRHGYSAGDRLKAIPQNAPSLIESLKQHGYLTGGISSNPIVGVEWGLRGFDYYNSNYNIGRLKRHFHPVTHLACLALDSFQEISSDSRIAGHMNSEVFAWLEQFSSWPFFLFLNYLDPHDPYDPLEPFDRVFREEGQIGTHDGVEAFKHRMGITAKREYEHYIGTQYDGEIAYLDQELGKLFQKMKDLGIYKSALIVITSDHGEFLGEHSLKGHMTHMYEEAIKVPLIIKLIQMVDILPTVLGICEVPVPEGLSGTPYGIPEKPIVGEFFSSALEGGIDRVIYEGQHKLMHYTQSKVPELYDLKEDPGEARDLNEEREDVSSMLSCRLTEWTKDHPARR
jgi:arylsulfatase A-like enzyme